MRLFASKKNASLSRLLPSPTTSNPACIFDYVQERLVFNEHETYTIRRCFATVVSSARSNRNISLLRNLLLTSSILFERVLLCPTSRTYRIQIYGNVWQIPASDTAFSNSLREPKFDVEVFARPSHEHDMRASQQVFIDLSYIKHLGTITRDGGMTTTTTTMAMSLGVTEESIFSSAPHHR